MPVFPTGDDDADLLPAYRFYEGITPRHPDQYQSPLREMEASPGEQAGRIGSDGLEGTPMLASPVGSAVNQ